MNKIFKIQDIIFIVLIGVPLISAIQRMAIVNALILSLALLVMLAWTGFISRCFGYEE